MPQRLLRLIKAREKLSLRRRRTQAGNYKAGVGADPENKNKHNHNHHQQHNHHKPSSSSVPPPHRQQSAPSSTVSSLPAAQESEIAGRAAAGAAKPEGIASHPHCGPGQQTEDDEGPRPAQYQRQHQEPQPRGSRKNPLQNDPPPPSPPPGRRTSLRDPPPCHSASPSATTITNTPRQVEKEAVPTKVPERVNPAAAGTLHSSFLETLDEDASPSRSRPTDTSPSHPAGVPSRPTIAAGRQSLLPPSQQHLVNSLLEPGLFSHDSDSLASPFNPAPLEMVQRKVWVRRPGASPTLISVPEDSVVDELRDHVLRKYANSLGKVYDAPDLIIRISPRESSNRPAAPDRILSPEEPVFPILDSYYPGGQTVEEALIIDAPQRRTPRPSPRQSYYYHAEPGEHGEYFPLMPVPINVGTPPAHPSSSISSASGVSAHQTPSISVLTTGKVPPLPSPGNRPSRHPPRRPPYARHTTNSPTLVASSNCKGIV